MSQTINELNLIPELSKNLLELEYTNLTPIQEISLPITLSGKDIIAQAKTGSGKTAAFGLALLNQLDIKNINPQALVLCPTRELAEQVANELRKLARMLKNTKVLTITGGTSEYHQDKSLSHGAHIIVGTPGRVRKLLTKKTMDISTVKKFVLDEADRMLDMGFSDDIEWINERIINKTQTMLFSATFPLAIEELSKDIQNNAQMVKVDAEHSHEVIEQVFVELDSHKDKMKALLYILAKHRPSRFIVFCKTKAISDKVSDELYANKIEALSIHGDLDQLERTRTLTLFSNQSISALVATDVAARGIDIKDLEMVVNFDLPVNAEIYTHRIGRTARAGNMGVAVSLYMDKEYSKLKEICEYLNIETKSIKKLYLDEIETQDQYDLKPPMQTIYIGGGKKNKLRPGDIVGAIIHNTDANADDIGDISISNVNTFVALKVDVSSAVVEKLSNIKIKNKNFKVGFVNP